MPRPPRKKVKTDQVQEGATVATGRVTRASSKAANAVAANAPQAQPPAQPPAAVAPVAPSVVKLRRGCLKEIPNFAVEIQLMIFCNLHPLDLFNLSRTSRMFHQFFLHRSNQPLWEVAFKNAKDLPEKPVWMSIPAFIHLFYATYCNNCGCPNIRKVVWPWFSRFCSNCLPKLSIDLGDVEKRFAGARCNIYPEHVLQSIRAPTAAKSQHGYGYQNQRQRVKWYLKRDVDEFLREWSAIPEPRGADTVKAFRVRRCDLHQQKWTHVLQCEYWHDRMEDARKKSLRDGRKDRFSAIVKKLMETGWAEDLDYLGKDGLEQMSRLPVVRQSGKLTDKGWEKVQEALRPFLDKTRGARLKIEREAIIQERFAELDEAIIAHCVTIPRDETMEYRPVALDLAFQADLEPIANAPVSETITRDTFAPIVPQLVAKWHTEQREVLESFLKPFIKKVPRGVDMLDLAIAIFYRSSYPSGEVRMLRYPYLLSSSSFRYNSFRDRERGDFPSSHYAAPAAGCMSGPFNLKYLEPKPVETGIKWMRGIVTKLGLDPDTATLADLEQCKARLRCLKCAELGEKQYAYGWEAALAHTAKNNTTRTHDAYPRSSHNRWARVNNADMVKVKKREAVAHALTVDSKCQWSCALCVKWTGSGGAGEENVREHLASEHGITDVNGVIEDGTIFWSHLHNERLKKPAVEL